MKSIMRNVLLLGVIAFFMSSCAGRSSYMQPAESLISPPGDKAVVRFMRPSGLGYAVNFNILDNNRVIGNSVAKSQFDYVADPGKHLFVAIAENAEFLEADLEGGKTYYIITQVKMGAWKARVGLVPVNRGSAFWDKVTEYENALIKLQTNTDVAEAWEAGNMHKIEALLDKYDGTKDWPKLSPEDGR